MRVDNDKDLRVRVYGKTFGDSEVEDGGVYKGLKDSGGSLDNFPSQQSTKCYFGIKDGGKMLELPFDWVLKGIELLWNRGLYG